MAVAGIAAAVLWLTPILNAERISANALVARYQSGKTAAADLDVSQLMAWGSAGAAALETLQVLAKEPGQDALAAALSEAATTTYSDAADPDPAKALADLVAVLPLQPATATADRDRLLFGMQGYELVSWLNACKTPLANGKPGCVMVIADFSPVNPGNEAIIVLRDTGDAMRYEAFVQIDGTVERRTVSTLNGYLPYDETGAEMIAQLQASPPKITSVPLNQISVGGRSLLIFP